MADFTFDKIKALFNQSRVFTKVVEAAAGDNTHIYFNLEQWIDPKRIRPVRALDAKADRTLSRNLFTHEWEKREVSEIRGGPKNTQFPKKTSVSKPPKDGVMYHFANDTYIGFVFEHDDYANVKEEKLVKLPRDKKTHLPKYVFNSNQVTNFRFWIKGQPNNHLIHQALHLNQIESENVCARDKGQILRHNEILACPSKASLRGIFVPIVGFRAPRLNALRVKYLIQHSPLKLDLPVFIMGNGTGIADYPLEDQVNDIFAAFASDKKDHPLQHQFANEVLERSFLQNDALWTAIKTKLDNCGDMKPFPQKLFNEVMALDSIASKKELSVYGVKVFLEFVQFRQRKVNLAELKIPSASFTNAIKNLIEERRFDAIAYSLNDIAKGLDTNENRIEILASLINVQEYELARNFIEVSEAADKNTHFAYEDPGTNNTGLGQLFAGKHPNLKPSIEVVKSLLYDDHIARENKDKKTPIELAIQRKYWDSVEYFLTEHFNAFSSQQLFRILLMLLTSRNFQLVEAHFEKFMDNKEVKAQFITHINEDYYPDKLSLILYMLSQTKDYYQPSFKLLEKIVNISDKGFQYASFNKPLFLAVKNNRWEVVEFFIKLDIGIFLEPSAWNLLIEKKQISLARAFFQKGNHPRWNLTVNDYYPIHTLLADEKPDYSFVKEICSLNNPPHLKEKNNQGKTILDILFEKKHWEMISYFINEQFNKLDILDVKNLFYKLLPFWQKNHPQAKILGLTLLSHMNQSELAVALPKTEVIKIADDNKMSVENHINVMNAFTRGLDSSTRKKHCFEYLMKVIDHLYPAEILDLIKRISAQEDQQPLIRHSHQPSLTFIRWENQPASNTWLKLINHAKKTLLIEVNAAPEKYISLKSEIELFLGKRTSVITLFSAPVTPEKRECDEIYRKYFSQLKNARKSFP